MSFNGENLSTTPPSFLPLYHSHNIALDSANINQKTPESASLQTTCDNDVELSNVTSSEEDFANGNLSCYCNSNSEEPNFKDALKENEVCEVRDTTGLVNKQFNVETLCFANNSDSNNAVSDISQKLAESALNNNNSNNDIADASERVVNNSLNKPLSWNDEFFSQSDSVENKPNLSDEPNSILSHSASAPNESTLPSGWRKLSDVEGSYYWNIDTGTTQYEVPQEFESSSDTEYRFQSVDSSLADLEGAAFRYASLHAADDESDHDDSSDWTVGSDTGRMFSVRSLGWLPMENFTADPETSSAEVNACIKHLSSSHGQIMDGIGAWGEGKDLLLLIENENLKLLDPLSQTVLQTQPIKSIRVWGVGGSNPHDFAYVSKDITKQYKCHVFRCDVSATAIAKELHNVCRNLCVLHKKSDKKPIDNEAEKEKLALSTNIPTPNMEPSTRFHVKYLGAKKVASVNGITTIKNVIRDVTTEDIALCEDALAAVSASALVITSKTDNRILVNCRMRCLSFMGIGDDISLFAFINVVAEEACCHVIQCQPNAVKLALAVQEACVLRLQKAVDSKNLPDNLSSPQPTTSRKSIRQFVKGIFTRKKTA